MRSFTSLFHLISSIGNCAEELLTWDGGHTSSPKGGGGGGGGGGGIIMQLVVKRREGVGFKEAY